MPMISDDCSSSLVGLSSVGLEPSGMDWSGWHPRLVLSDEPAPRVRVVGDRIRAAVG